MAIKGEIGAIALVVGQILGLRLLISMNGGYGLQFSIFLFEFLGTNLSVMIILIPWVVFGARVYLDVEL